MAYKHCTANYPFFPTYVECADDKGLQRCLSKLSDIDFGDYAPRGGGTTLAKLRWQGEDGVTFEGVGVAPSRLSANISAERLAADWIAFVGQVRQAHELEAFHRRREELRRAG